MGLMADATGGYVLLDGLKALADRLASEIDCCDDPKLVPQLARQYRETMVKIDELEGGEDAEDEVAAIIVRNRQPSADQHGGA